MRDLLFKMLAAEFLQGNCAFSQTGPHTWSITETDPLQSSPTSSSSQSDCQLFPPALTVWSGPSPLVTWRDLSLWSSVGIWISKASLSMSFFLWAPLLPPHPALYVQVLSMLQSPTLMPPLSQTWPAPHHSPHHQSVYLSSPLMSCSLLWYRHLFMCMTHVLTTLYA